MRAFRVVVPEHVPETWIEPNEPSGAARVLERLEFPFVAKLPRSSQGEGVFLVRDRADWQRYLALTPVIYVQEYLPIDRDLRIVRVGDRVVGCYRRLQGETGFHNNLARGGVIDRSPVPVPAQALIERLAGMLDINHAGFDIAMVDGHPYVLEFNRLSGSRGLETAADPVPAAILDYLAAATDHSDPGDPTRPPLRAAI